MIKGRKKEKQEKRDTNIIFPDVVVLTAHSTWLKESKEGRVLLFILVFWFCFVLVLFVDAAPSFMRKKKEEGNNKKRVIDMLCHYFRTR
jgi:hypothetical protein